MRNNLLEVTQVLAFEKVLSLERDGALLSFHVSKTENRYICTCAYSYTEKLTKVISLSEKAYGTLKKLKRGKESFSDVVLRLSSREEKKSILDLAGTWQGSDLDQVFSTVEKERNRSGSRKVEF